ncbi:NADH dehydrogenase [ubiquinone] 1 alpha subcomplex subunit 6-like [Anthonomus grandis grandis]|uniref:NADH dehydrogenase [ubiquinone] 1 alpha subcomplex subunit 6-like n=1 Tax=Anthonomus grandis grandis TaxID=2921223 RepID=UPI002166494A|nr:NADH dehydrogenase [ubiquinone] 1 alpha subcomplex subunit 6-like [Anthonomus grandis grandis]
MTKIDPMNSETTKKVFREVRPLLSLDPFEAKRRVFALYKAWYRHIPYILKHYDVELSEEQCKKKLREQFNKHAKINDIRVIDMLVIKGQMDLQEIVEKWISTRGVGRFFKPAHEEVKTDEFLSKFLRGKE